MTDYLIDLLLTTLILLSLYGYGRVLRRAARLTFWSRAADLAYALAFGLGVITTLWFGLGLVGLLIPLTGWIVLVVGLVLAAWQYRMLVEDFAALANSLQQVTRENIHSIPVLLVGFAFVVMVLVANIAPPTEGDTVHQYLLLPRYWVETGRYTQPTHIWASTLPGNMMMLSTWALLLRHSYALATLVTGFGMSLFFALSVYTVARLYFDRGVALMATLIAYMMPTTFYLATSGKVDMGWAFFEALTLAAFFKWLDDSEHSQTTLHWLIISGLCLGWAAGSKNQTPISITLLGMWLVLRLLLKRDWRGMLRAGLTFGLAILATAFPYYLYNGIEYLNPFYPVFADQFTVWFGAAVSPRSELGTEVFYIWSVSGYFKNLWNASLGHSPAFYLGFIAGPVFLLMIPAAWMLGVLRGESKIRRMVLYAAVFSIVWFLVKQAARHFIPGLILLSVVAGVALWRIAHERGIVYRVVGVTFIIALVGELALGAATLVWNGAYRVALTLETREEYLQRWHDTVIGDTFPDWETITYLNDNYSAEDRILAEHANSSLYITPQLVAGSWGDRVSYAAIIDADRLLETLKLNGIHYILDYKHDPSGPELFNQTEFLEAHGSPIYENRRVRLYRIQFP